MVHIAVDGGGTNLRAARFNNGFEEGRITVPTDAESYSKTLAALHGSIDELRGGQKLDGIGVSIAGSTDGERIIAAGNLGAFAGEPFAYDLRTMHGCPVWLFNDGQAMGASEYSVQGTPLVFAIWGSGVNFAFVLGDDIFSPAGGGPSIIGEGGHQRIDDDAWGGRKCGCGQLGCLEAYTGGTSIERHYGYPAERLNETEWDAVLSRMAHGVHNVITLTGGRLPIFFGGGIACRQAARLPVLTDKLKETQLIVPTLPTISRATHGEDAGLHGASRIVEHQLAAA
ncbi:MAG TPA: ROK family protein [Candidatus Saccharimonadales bacterium]